MKQKKPLKKFIVVSRQKPKVKSKYMIRDITHIYDKSKSEESDSTQYHDDLIESLYDMEKIIIKNQNTINVMCNCFQSVRKCFTK